MIAGIRRCAKLSRHVKLTSEFHDPTNLDIAVALEVKLREATDVTSSIHMNRKFPKKVNDGRGAIREREPQDEGD